MKEAYKELVSSPVADVLVQAVRSSTAHQYHSVWSSFCSFVKERNFSRLTSAEVFDFFIFLFSNRKLAPSTVTAYKSALVRPLRVVFNIDLNSPMFLDFTKALGNIRPNPPPAPIRWSLDKALSLALSPRFQSSPSLRDRTAVLAFLLALATGSRGSELHAVLRGSNFIVFSGDGVSFYPNPNFLAKNEDPQHRRPPIFISKLSWARRGPTPALSC